MDNYTSNVNLSNNFLNYIQAKEIPKFFHEITMAYAINQPDDHVLFLRNFLCSTDKTQDAYKIIIIASPHIGRRKLAEQIAEALNLLVISFQDIRDEQQLENTAERFAVSLRNIIREKSDGKNGWILYDYPRERNEARAMLKAFIIPSHTFILVPTPQYFTKRDLWNENLIGKDPKEVELLTKCFMIQSIELKETFKTSLKEIYIRGRTLEQVVKACVAHAKLVKHIEGGGGPPRVVVIGDISLEMKHILEAVCDKININLVDMEEVICQGRSQDSQLGDLIRNLEKKGMAIYGRIAFDLLQNRLLSPCCLKDGWLLINFPRDATDFLALDATDTPPNRIIFLTPTDYKKYELLKGRKFLNLHEISVEFKDSLCAEEVEGSAMETLHNTLTLEQFKELLENYDQYGILIDTAQPTETLFEEIERYIKDPLYVAPKRIPITKEERIKQLLEKKLLNGLGDSPKHEYDYDENLLMELKDCMKSGADSDAKVSTGREMNSSSDEDGYKEIFPWKTIECNVNKEVNATIEKKTSEYDRNSPDLF